MMRKLRVSHETIYRSLFVQSRGVLRRELTRHLRTGRSVRRSKAHRGLVGDGRGQLTGIVHICQRPAEAEDRAVPGHWEADLGLGKAMSGIATLVERSSRFLLLIKLERIDSQDCRRRAGSAHSHVARTTAPLVDLGSRQPNGPARQVHHRHWCADLVL
jgi:IS30 family transposase